MSNVVFGIVSTLVLGIAFVISVCVGHLSAILHEESNLLIPQGNPDCLRLLPLVSNVEDLGNSVSLIALIFLILFYSKLGLYFKYGDLLKILCFSSIWLICIFRSVYSSIYAKNHFSSQLKTIDSNDRLR